VTTIPWLALGALWLGGCALPSADKGGSCTRSNQCPAGLVCVAGKCSDDLAPIVKQSQVPKPTSKTAAPTDDGG
jgi:hypothetical protein